MKSKNPMQHTLHTLKRQAGMTLMEIIAALAIIAAVVVGALSLFSSAQSSNSAVTMLKDVIAIRSAVQQLYTGQGGYPNNAGAINTQIQNARKAPSDLVWQAGPANYRTSWNGVLNINGTANNSPDFTITLSAVPADVCVLLVTSAANGWRRVQVGGANFPNAGQNFPVPPAWASANCNQAAAGSQIIWTTLN